MSRRANQDRERALQPQRMKSCLGSLEKLGLSPRQVDDTEIQFELWGNLCRLWPYSGWWSCKGIGSGRGFENLLRAIESKLDEIINYPEVIKK